MFGKKNPKEQPEKKTGEHPLEIETIPKAFYGGKNPNVYEPQQEQKKPEPPKEKITEVPKQMTAPVGSLSPTNELQAVAKNHMQPQKMIKKPAQAPVQYGSKHSRGKMVALIFLLLIVLIAAATWYVLRDVLQSNTAVTPPTTPPVTTPVPEPEPPTTTVEVPEPEPPTTTIEVPEPITQVILEFPRTTFVVAPDRDSDGLTDEEEFLFGTDGEVADTDEDGYVDGLELANLYNPQGIAPRRIIDSGLVREYIHTSNQYRLYHPTVVNATPVDPLSEQVLLNFISGDYISITVVPLRTASQGFREWFSENAQSQQFSDLTEQENRFEISYLERTDGLVAYFVTDRAVFVLSYHPGIGEELQYKNIFNMVVQSFRPNRSVPQELPEQPIVPGTTSSSSPATTTEDISTTTPQ